MKLSALKSKLGNIVEGPQCFEIRCFIDRKRKKTNELSKRESRNFLVTANHLVSFLKKEYRIN